MGYRYHIGLDAHTVNCFFVILDREGKLCGRGQVKTGERALLDVVRAVRGPKALACEESTLSQWLYMLLKDEVDQLVICNPAAIMKRPGPKTDFIDAMELADLLRVNRLKSVFHTADERMDLRALVSGYDDLVQEIVRAKNRFKAIFRRSAIRLTGSGVYQEEGLLEQLGGETQRFVAQQLQEQIVALEKQKKVYLRRFRQNLKRFPEMGLIQTVPGFDAIRTNQVVGLVVSPHRFADKYHFFSYAMLIKHRQLSDSVTYGKCQAYGKSKLKGIFKMAARDVLRTHNAFRAKYDRMLSSGSSSKAASNAVARALAATVLAIWKGGKRYNDNYREAAQNKCKRKV